MHFHVHAISSCGTSHGPKSVFKVGFFIKCHIITVLKINLKRFGQYLKKSKNGSPLYFQNVFLNWPKVF